MSTAQVYAGLRVKLTKFFSSAKILQYALKKGDLSLINKSRFNVLEKKAFSVCAYLRTVQQYLQSKGYAVRMTGSGSAFYTVDRSWQKSPFSSAGSTAHSVSRDPLLVETVKSLTSRKWMQFQAYTF